MRSYKLPEVRVAEMWPSMLHTTPPSFRCTPTRPARRWKWKTTSRMQLLLRDQLRHSRRTQNTQVLLTKPYQAERSNSLAFHPVSGGLEFCTMDHPRSAAFAEIHQMPEYTGTRAQRPTLQRFSVSRLHHPSCEYRTISLGSHNVQ